jgi:hypothetical protein
MKQMDGTHFDQSLKVLAPSAGRRHALRSLSAAGMALLIGLGLADGGDARKAKTQDGGNRHRPGDAHADGKGKGKGKGKRGPAGPAGPTGPTGPANGPAPASVIRFGPEERATGNFLQSVAECQSGEHAVSGGYFINLFDDQTINFLENTPSPLTNGTVPTAWAVGVNTADPGGDKSVKAFVICVPDEGTA